MTQAASVTKPGSLGDAVFITHDGLIAEGNGYLASLKDASQIVEFRSSSGNDSHLPRDSEALFLKSVRVNSEHAWLFGVVRRQKDAAGRLGFMGACRLLDSEEHEPKDHSVDLFRQFHDFVRHRETVLANVRHPSKIGFLTRSPVKSAELLSFGEGGFHAFCIEGDQLTEMDIRRMERVALALPNLADTILLWPFRSNDVNPLTERNVEVTEAEHADRVERTRVEQAQKAAERDAAVRANDPRRKAFERRTSYLKYPRPDDVDHQTEDYLIGLIEFVIDQKGPETEVGSFSRRAAKDIYDRRDHAFGKAMVRSPLGSYVVKEDAGVLDWLRQNLNRVLLIVASGAAFILLFAMIVFLVDFFGSSAGVGPTPGEKTPLEHSGQPSDKIETDGS